jgi:hypothetical protein
MDALPCDILRILCTFLDARALVHLERTHKCEWTDLAWANILQRRLQLSLVNRSVLLENPRSAAKTILDAPDARLYHDHDTQELLHQTAAWAHEFGSLAYNPLTPRVMNAMLIAL